MEEFENIFLQKFIQNKDNDEENSGEEEDED